MCVCLCMSVYLYTVFNILGLFLVHTLVKTNRCYGDQRLILQWRNFVFGLVVRLG